MVHVHIRSEWHLSVPLHNPCQVAMAIMMGWKLNNGVHDVSPSTHPPLVRKVILLEDEDGNIHLKNLSLHPATNEEEGNWRR